MRVNKVLVQNHNLFITWGHIFKLADQLIVRKQVSEESSSS